VKLATLLLVAAICGTGAQSKSAIVQSPQAHYKPTVLNGRDLNASLQAGAYSYWVGGHLYGAPQNTRSIFPAASLLGNLQQINAGGASFFMSLGDAIRFCTPPHYAMFKKSFANHLEMPLLNAVGNHDVAVRARYLEQFPGETSHVFAHGKTLHLTLDAEEDPGRISGLQLRSFLAALRIAQSDPAFASVAIYSHKLLWAGGRPKFKVVFDHMNSKDGYRDDDLFTTEVLPALRELGAKKQVIWFSGDIGCSHTLPLFYAEEPDVDLTWIATGIGDTEVDSILKVEVDGAGRMTPSVFRLDGKESKPLSHFSFNYWEQHFSKK